MSFAKDNLERNGGPRAVREVGSDEQYRTATVALLEMIMFLGRGSSILCNANPARMSIDVIKGNLPKTGIPYSWCLVARQTGLHIRSNDIES